jgi:hypothetical protein
MIFTADNIDDIRRYYLQSYVKLRDFGETLCFLEDIVNKVVDDMSVRCVTGTLSNGDLFSLPLWADQPYEVEYVLPKKSLFVYEKQLHHLRRLPARQYHRGICQENTAIVSFSRGRWQGVELTATLLQAYVDKPDIVLPTQASASKSSGPIMLSRRFALDPVNERVFCDTVVVGVFDNGGVRVKNLFYPEMSLLLQNTDINVGVL